MFPLASDNARTMPAPVIHLPVACLLADRATRHRARLRARPHDLCVQSMHTNSHDNTAQVPAFCAHAELV
ncbi:MAG: hypothetical protein DCC65_09000 [Planctomycetota bacterium]|nr:MAG: hypothetical protein DCC65_09000 [Planctomycetota bacterium]